MKWVVVFGIFVTSYLVVLVLLDQPVQAEPWVEIVLLFGLVFVNMAYTTETRGIRGLTSKTVDEMKQQRLWSLKPVVLFQGPPRMAGNQVLPFFEALASFSGTCALKNAGPGAALNVTVRRSEPNRRNPARNEVCDRLVALGPGDMYGLGIDVGHDWGAHDLVAEYEHVSGLEKWRSGITLQPTEEEGVFVVRDEFYEQVQ